MSDELNIILELKPLNCGTLILKKKNNTSSLTVLLNTFGANLPFIKFFQIKKYQ